MLKLTYILSVTVNLKSNILSVLEYQNVPQYMIECKNQQKLGANCSNVRNKEIYLFIESFMTPINIIFTEDNKKH